MASFNLHTLHTLKSLQVNGFAHPVMQNSMPEIQKGVDREDWELKKLLNDPEALPIFELLYVACLNCLKETEVCILYRGSNKDIRKLGFRNIFWAAQRTHELRMMARALSRYIRLDDPVRRHEMLSQNHKLYRCLYIIWVKYRTCEQGCIARFRMSNKELAHVLPYMMYGKHGRRITNFSGKKAFLL